MAVALKAPAKINLYLRILGKRPDGYHDIDTLMQAIDLCDELWLQKADRFDLQCEGLDDLPAEQNLVYRAARLMADRYRLPGVKIRLRKCIPTGAGLGGGSSDAAAVIRGLVQLYGLKPRAAELSALALEIGSDVPFFLGRGQARAVGRGEVLTEIRLPTGYWVVLVKPDFSVATTWAYQQVRIPLTRQADGVCLEKRISLSRFVMMAGQFANDFEQVVFSYWPELERSKKEMERLGAFHTALTGSGSAVYGLFLKEKQARYASEWLSGRFASIFVCQPVRMPAVT